MRQKEREREGRSSGDESTCNPINKTKHRKRLKVKSEREKGKLSKRILLQPDFITARLPSHL